MNCQELRDLLTDYETGDLVIEQRQVIEIHLNGCQSCGVLVETYRCTIRLARALPKRGQLPPSLEARLRQALEPHLDVTGDK
jgi:predicted anti-sigma-YlaC factor YlaD